MDMSGREKRWPTTAAHRNLLVSARGDVAVRPANTRREAHRGLKHGHPHAQKHHRRDLEPARTDLAKGRWRRCLTAQFSFDAA